ncbi:Phage shock protein A [Flexibacter flexilis DSM 6793]|uniref:Phage shock protein A n=1 Tax=Flexibacter flexilis DSM 6793 TaxID=927664 RepID=A0A1I1DTE0_9BACT|nr:PspA/IM30 family protein [Flexibacter flexilis]SFB77692.1 Phage shock protein A [Flexibacter flexilis DSM 6793]
MGLMDSLYTLLKSKEKEKETPPEPSPEQLLDEAITQLQFSLRKSEDSFRRAQANQQDVGRQLAQYQDNAKRLNYDAVQAMRQGKEAQARDLLSRKVSAEQQAAQMEQLYRQVSETTAQLEQQRATIQLQLQELRGKKVMLSVQMEKATQQKEVAAVLQNLEANSLPALETQLLQAQLEAGYTPLDMELAQLEKQDQDRRWQAELEQQQKALEQAQLEQQTRKIDSVFKQHEDKEKAIVKQQKAQQQAQQKEDIKQFWEQAAPETPKTNDIDTFFRESMVQQPPQTPTPPPIEQFFEEKKESAVVPNTPALDDFFKEKPSPTPPQTPDFDAFFGKEKEPPTDSQRKIDDFFND